ncbi:hypothetical protein SCHPADRAFT_941939 [Schizopora paradoxa]|uniref:Uncharacterized protein n=1 Tax=Schizopora paradoxa TaxID=27342 RepID=A0A0H2RI37_9AGAM|nr:hypothetical protein SCHPADRAFT_941939 [Schizopora paradoxa]
MAFHHYSDLFKSGLLSESSSPLTPSHPYGPAHDGRLPTITQDVPLSPARTSTRDVEHSIASGDSLYFTFKKRRDPSEFRSFLSLDLAESQSLRSASLKGKPSQELLHKTSRLTSSSRRSMSTFPPIMAVQSPPPTSPVRGSFRSLSTGSTPFLSMSPPSPFNTSSFIHAPIPRRPLKLTIPQIPAQRELSPMMFASPPPSPPLAPRLDHAAATRPEGVLSRTSSVSTGYRTAKRGDALAQLEGRGGYRGRRSAPVAQNFMSMSDDEDEDDGDGDTDRNGFEAIVEDVMEEESAWQTSSGPSRTRSSSIERGLMASINDGPWYDLNPQKDPFTMLFDDDHESIEPIRLSPFDHVVHHPSSSHSSIASSLRRSKRSKFSRSPSREVFREKNIDSSKSTPQSSRKSLLPFRPTPSSSRSHSQTHLHPNSHSNTNTHSRSSPSSRPQSSIAPSSSVRSKSTPGSRTSSSSQHSRRNSSDQPSTKKRQPRHHEPLQRLTLNLDWLSSKADIVNFIDMLDDAPESDSRSDSWRSIFEVSCNA